MKNEKESASIQSGKSHLCATNDITEVSTPSLHYTDRGATIDFHSAEFNRIDDLNDYSGNYRSFQPLDDICTTDMRHQMEHRHNRSGIVSAVNDAAPLKKMESENDEPEPAENLPPLTIISEGRTLIIDTDAERAIACGKMLTDQLLTCTLLVTNKASKYATFSRLSRLTLIEVAAVSITGAFGSFSAMADVEGDQKYLTELFNDEAAAFDLVLDLQPTPSFSGDRLPVGYYAPGPNQADIDDAMEELPEMRGRFRKPQFTAFMKRRCIHGRSRTRECRQCLDVCPFGAIQSEDHNISINHYLCQGCGGCALVCPADAIRMVHPPQKEVLNSLLRLLEKRLAGANFPLSLIISGFAVDNNRQLLVGDKNPEGMVGFEIEQISYVGLEMILAALAYGMGKVVVTCGPQDPPSIRKAVTRQTQMANAILKGLDMPEDNVRFVFIPPEDDYFGEEALGTDGLDVQSNNSPMPPWASSPVHDRRALVRLAIQHLYDQSGATRPWLALPAGSPFGTVTVDTAACTLCMACAASCPTGALSASGNAPRLLFRESQCHQCGLCEETCPEHAIQLLSRILCDPDTVEAQVVLREDEPFLCVECGVPFASPAMIKRMQKKLMGHWMYVNERQLRRLQMCCMCRTRDALTSEDVKSWNR